MGLVLLSAIIALVYQSVQRDERISTAKESKFNLELFKSQARDAQNQTLAAQQAQVSNTRDYISSLQTFSDKVGKLQTKAATEQLNVQIGQLQSELKTAEITLNPKSSLVFSMKPVPIVVSDKPFHPLMETTIPLTKEGNIHAEFAVMNLNETPAEDGELMLFICDACKFAVEPVGSFKITAPLDTQRNVIFNRILPFSNVNMSVDITPPC